MLIHLVVVFCPTWADAVSDARPAPAVTYFSLRPDLETNCLAARPKSRNTLTASKEIPSEPAPLGRSTARIRVRIRSACPLSNRTVLWDVGWWIVANPAEN